MPAPIEAMPRARPVVEFFFEGRLAQARTIADGSYGLIHFLLKKMQGDVFLGPEIIKDGAFGSPSLVRNGLSCRSVKAPGLKERQRGGYNSLPNRCLVLRAAPNRTLHFRSSSARLRFRERILLCAHNKIREY